MPTQVEIVPATQVTRVQQKGVIHLETPKTEPAPQAPAKPAPAPKAAPAPPSPEPKPVKASDDFYGKLRQKAEHPKPEAEVKLADKPTEPAEPTEPEAEAPDETEEEVQPSAEKVGEVTPPEGVKTDTKKAKVNPWKLVEEYKGARAKLEQEIVDLRKMIPREEERKQELERLQKAEQKAKELEEEIKYVNYQKHPEFQEKYEKPYLDAWKRAVAELGELTVEDTASGTERPATPQDLADLVNLPLSKARELASERFGEFANDVLFHRKELRRLFEERSTALEKAKTESVEREQKLTQQRVEQEKHLRSTLKEVWDKASEAALTDPDNAEYFKPVEGDEERNALLQKGYELVDTSFTKSPLDPELSQEDRVALVRKHAAIRHRAAAYGTLKYLLAKEREARRAAEQKLKQFADSMPGTEAAPQAPEAGKPTSAWDSVMQNLRARAK